jgi:hypothetical protein
VNAKSILAAALIALVATQPALAGGLKADKKDLRQ